MHMTTPVLGSKLRQKRVISDNGLDIGYVLDAEFDASQAKLTAILIKPEHETKEIKEYVNEDHVLKIPYERVSAIGRHVIVKFPF